MAEPKGNGNGEGKTLWEMLKEKWSKDNAPISFYNPLDYRIGSQVAVAKTRRDFADYDFSVKEFQEYTRRIEGKEFKFTDSVLTGTNTKTFDAEDAVTVRLRTVPNLAGTHDTLLLCLYDELAFDAGFLEVVKDRTGIFDVTDDNTGQVDRHTRINDVLDPYEVIVLVVTGTTDDGKALPKHATPMKLEYWDYWRDVPIAEGAATRKQFLFVEMNSDTGWLQLWQGQEFFF